MPTPRARRDLPLALLALCLAATPLSAQAPSPDSLAALVMRAFSSGTPEEFAAVYPDSEGRVFMREARGIRRTELAQVVWRGGRRAVLLLGGVVRAREGGGRGAGAGGNETNGARHFSGFYEATESGGRWTLTRQIPLDSESHIRAQRLHVDVTPASGIHVVDTLEIAVGLGHGFAARLNNAAHLDSVRVDGRPAEHAFGGGVLWVRVPPTPRARLVLSYSLEASRGGNSASGSDTTAAAAPAYGAFHNTDVWHPFFDYLSANDLAQLTATVRIPAEYYLTTTVPQVDTVRDGVRTVYARSADEQFLLALIYDRDWRPRTTDFGTFRFESFTGPTFRHSHDSLAAATKRVYDVLAPRFGEPHFPARYLAAVQDRALGAGGFSVRMNNAAISGGGGGGALDSRTSQVFAHETGHAWTMNATGRAANFLREAWGTYVEALMYRALHDADAERAFWERQRAAYVVGSDRQGFAGGFEGAQSILGNYDNGRIHYRKGVWIFYSGNYVMGDSAFARGMRSYVEGMGAGRRGYEELIAAWSRAAGRDMTSFVMPWLTSRYTPDVDARVDGRRLIVTQQQPGELFDLPRLEVELTTPSGVLRKTMHLRHRADTLDVGDVDAVTATRVDPDHHFLVRRHWGEPAVRFELPVSRVPDVRAVQLNGNFLRAPIAATRSGDAWVVELPMTEGEYVWAWQVEGGSASAGGSSAAADSSLTGTRVVRPLQRVTDAYPGR
jgi:hypothetical protein